MRVSVDGNEYELEHYDAKRLLDEQQKVRENKTSNRFVIMQDSYGVFIKCGIMRVEILCDGEC